MEITKEMLQNQVASLTKGIEDYKQGYIQALAWVIGVLEQKAEEPKKD